jgi:hypothetical protein
LLGSLPQRYDTVSNRKFKAIQELQLNGNWSIHSEVPLLVE